MRLDRLNGSDSEPREFAATYLYFISSLLTLTTAPLSVIRIPDDTRKSSAHAMGSTTPSDHRKRPRLIGHGGVIPLRISTILTLCIFFSLLFILVISLAFLGEDGDVPYFKKTLDDVAQNTPGVLDLFVLCVKLDLTRPNRFTDCFAGRKRRY
jgi:hypothetical protein